MKFFCNDCKVSYQVNADKLKTSQSKVLCPKCRQPLKPMGGVEPKFTQTTPSAGDDPFWQPPSTNPESAKPPTPPITEDIFSQLSALAPPPLANEDDLLASLEIEKARIQKESQSLESIAFEKIAPPQPQPVIEAEIPLVESRPVVAPPPIEPVIQPIKPAPLPVPPTQLNWQTIGVFAGIVVLLLTISILIVNRKSEPPKPAYQPLVLPADPPAAVTPTVATEAALPPAPDAKPTTAEIKPPDQPAPTDQEIAAQEAALAKGVTLLKLGKGGGGLQQAYGMDHRHLPSALAMAGYYQSKERYLDLTNVAQELIKYHPERYEGHLFAMQAFAGRNKTTDAETHADRALELAPNDMELNMAVADYYAKRGNVRQATGILENAMRSQDKMPRQELAKVYAQLGQMNAQENPEKSVFYLQKLIDWQIESAGVLNSLGLAYLALKQYQKAADTLAKALAKSPRSLPIKFNLALTHYRATSFGRAEQLFKEVTSDSPKHQEAYYYLSLIREQKGDRMQAIQFMSRVVQINPSHEAAKVKLKQLKSGT